MSNRIQSRLTELIAKLYRRSIESEREGILDPDYGKNEFINPRFQEGCLLFAGAVRLRVGIPDEVSDNELEEASISAMRAWFELQHRKGGVIVIPHGKADHHATAYGLIAISRALDLLGERVPGQFRSRAEKRLVRAATTLSRMPQPLGLETVPLRFAAFHSTSDWTLNSKIESIVVRERIKAYSAVSHALDTETENSLDAGVLALILAFFTLCIDKPSEQEKRLWQRILRRCLISTTPTGFFGGGAEVSVACLPVMAGFQILAAEFEDAAEIVRRMDIAWEEGIYDQIFEDSVPHLNPIWHLTLLAEYARVEREKSETPSPKPVVVDPVFHADGSGFIEMEDWQIRLGRGMTVGWIHHSKSESIRILSSPEGLYEGPWLFRKDHFFQPGISGDFQVQTENPYSIEGTLRALSLHSSQALLPGAEELGLKSRKRKYGPRLVPQHKPLAMKRYTQDGYWREIEMKDGALTIETRLSGQCRYRLPVVWIGGVFGAIRVGNNVIPAARPFDEINVREITLIGGPYPNWVVRFDHPVMVSYSPIRGLVHMHPLRYFNVASGVLDIIMSDRLHMAWRVEE